MSHASWWDVLVGYYLARRVIGVESYAPMDEAQLRRYRILTRLGVYSSALLGRGHARVLSLHGGLLARDARCGSLPRARSRRTGAGPCGFRRAIGHLVRRGSRASRWCRSRVAYEFLDEPRPEIFVKLGPPRGSAASGAGARTSSASSRPTSSASSTPSAGCPRGARPLAVHRAPRGRDVDQPRLRPGPQSRAWITRASGPCAPRRRRVRSTPGGP